MSYGLKSAGLQILAGIDNDKHCRATYEINLPGSKFIKHDLVRLTAPELGRRLGLKPNDPHLVFAGCSPCQFWSKIRTDKTKSKKSAFLLHNFERFIKYFLPGFIIVENVPGLLTKKSKSILPGFLEFLEKQGYNFDDGIVNANHFGVPQNRKRYVLIASRLVDSISLPAPIKDSSLVVSNFIGISRGFAQIASGSCDESGFHHTAASLSEKNLMRIKMTPKSGGDRSVWKNNKTLQIDAYRGKDDIFRDVYARMYWNRPAPTITTRFISFSNGRFGHPEEDRAVSLREGATLQTFPKSFVFKGENLNILARHIGNAVPPEMARRIGEHLTAIVKNG